jgi:aspartyl/asparaginyl beta-hydroxylase (cupin superfamily)
MAHDSVDPSFSVQSGFAALRAGGPQAARDHFQKAVEAGVNDPNVWFGLSVAHRQLGAEQEERRALNQALALDGDHLPALIATGDWSMRAQDLRAADAFYGAALKAASLRPPPPELRPQLERVAAARRELMSVFEAHLQRKLDEAGVGQPGAERVAHAMDLLLGRRELYLQQPRYFYFPGLPQIQFYARAQFPWAGELEAATDEICEELVAVLAERTGIGPYMQTDPSRPRLGGHALTNNPDWSACWLIKDGVEVTENASRCPRTMAAVRKVPLSQIDGHTPSVLFSLLKPGARIPPHFGYTNARLICHLPLITPPGCGIRVGNETHEWRKGELVVFDDSIEHEAWNGGEALRAVLLFDIWRPELSEQECALVTTLLSSVNGVAGDAKWTD